ncbi:hypothetical protein H6800_03535 [Candidatus Nomurabacteria bacterium]|nr:hypothetical protein [Candidatus Nomurabacteria bacterium]
MSYFEEMSYCPIQEYEAWESSRLTPDSIIVDERYMLMILLSHQVGGHNAFKLPTRVKHLEKQSDNIHVVRFTPELPGMTEKVPPVESEMRDGYIGKLQSGAGNKISFNGITAKRAYFRGHFGPEGGIDDELRNILDAEEPVLV